MLAIVAMAVAVALPAAAMLRDGGRAAAGARTMATLLSAQRWKSVAGAPRPRAAVPQGRRAGGRGARSPTETGTGCAPPRSLAASIRSSSRTTPWSARSQDVTLGIPPGGPYPEAPPGTDMLSAADDPVRFGRSDLVSFSPVGSASSGTIYVTDGRRGLFAVVLFGPTARLRVWRFSPEERRWTL